MRRTIVVMLVAALVLDVAYWSIWFISRDTLASEHRAAYYEFENAFPLADFWLGVAVLFALVALLQSRPVGVLLADLLGGRGAVPVRHGLPLRRRARHLRQGRLAA